MAAFFFSVLYQPLYNLLVFVYTVAPWGGLGLAIIVMTIIVKTLVLPLTYKSMKSQKELQELQPKIAEIKEKFKDDKETMAKELMGVYKVHNVNPFASCLPTIVQLFVFIALYKALEAGIHTVNPEILYDFVQNPGTMSPMFLGIDLSKVSILLAALSAICQYFQAKQMITRRPPAAARGTGAAMDEDMTATMNKMMLYMLPIMMFGLGATTLVGGVTLYILVSTAFTYGMYELFLSPKKAYEVVYNSCIMALRLSGKLIGVVAGGTFGVGLLYALLAKEGWENVLQNMSAFGAWPFIGFVAISMLNFVLYSIRWTMILHRQVSEKKHKLSLWRMYWHRMTGYAVGYLTPLNQAGGEPVRVALLMADGVPAKSAVASATLDIAFELCSYVVFIALGVIFALIGQQGGTGTLVVMGVGLAAAFAIFLSFFIALARGKAMARPLFHMLRLNRVKRLRGAEHWLEATEGLMRGFFSKGSGGVVGIAALSMTMVAFRVVETFYIAWGFGVSLNFTQAFLISSLPGLALLLPVPGGLGIFEGGFAAVFAALAVPMSPIAFALIIRLRDVVFIVFGVAHMMRTGTSWAFKKTT